MALSGRCFYIGEVFVFVRVFVRQKKTGSLWGGMNSRFYHEFMVFSMGSISAKIAYYLGKFDYTISVMVLGSGITVTGP